MGRIGNTRNTVGSKILAGYSRNRWTQDDYDKFIDVAYDYIAPSVTTEDLMQAISVWLSHDDFCEFLWDNYNDFVSYDYDDEED